MKNKLITHAISIPIEMPARRPITAAVAAPTGKQDLDALEEARQLAAQVARALDVKAGDYSELRARFAALMQIVDPEEAVDGVVSPSELLTIKSTPGATVKGYLAAKKRLRGGT